MILSETIKLNGQDRLSNRDYKYFECCQSINHFECSPEEGINVYSFGLFPSATQPSGACNMGQIDTIDISMQLSPKITVGNSGQARAYALVENVLRISYGLAGVLFTK